MRKFLMVHVFSQQLTFRINIKNNVFKDTEHDTDRFKVIRISE